jgi:hypothetical protein
MVYTVTEEGIDYSANSSIMSLYGSVLHVISAPEEGRPDLIANDAYGDSDLWWVLCIANGLVYGFNAQFRFKAYDEDAMGKKIEQPSQGGLQHIPDYPTTNFLKDLPMHNKTIIYDCYKSEFCIGRSILVPSIQAVEAFVNNTNG